mmetsp:Transcript_15087/g.36221  ORF Transcript_15087/g.36221 Transcript_15087/m.36221 type:complete len:625 (-) Transcript_15087:141-2015(-)
MSFHVMMAHTISSITPMRLGLLKELAPQFIGHRPRHFHRGVAGAGAHGRLSFVSPRAARSAANIFQYQQRRRYQISSLAKDNPSSGDDDGNNRNSTMDKTEDNDIDAETMARHNTLSRRLYRTLLRTCGRGVEIANGGNTFDEYGSATRGIAVGDGGRRCRREDDDKSWILLQPPMDPRKYGFARIVEARRGEFSVSKCNRTVRNMSLEEVGMAMEVLRFVHISLGGDADDDLEDYYLESYDDNDDDDDDDNVLNADDDGDEAEDVKDFGAGAAAGRHSEGHYTQFVDEDEERGEGNVSDSLSTTKDQNNNTEDDDEIIVDEDWDSDDDEGDNMERDTSVLVTSADLQNAVRIAFRAPLVSKSQSEEEVQPLSIIMGRRHRDAINACSQLTEQFALWGHRSSVSVDYGRGTRIVATSALMMGPMEGASRKYRFSYRIRVENIADTLDDVAGEEGREQKTEDDGQQMAERRAVQLLGRTWVISERGPRQETSSSLLQRLLEEGTIANIENNDGKGDEKETAGDGDRGNELRIVQTINEPKTGAVGHLPVLGPGEVFEYMSGTDAATPSGAMEGCFHMARVDMQDTDSAHVGDTVEALKWTPDDERRFEMPVGRFGLVAEDDNDVR